MDRISHQHVKRLMDGRPETRASRTNVCPICEHPDWCLVDAAAAICQRAASGGVQVGEAGRLFVVDENAYPAIRTRRRRRLSESEAYARFAPMARRYFVRRKLAVESLAAELGVPTWTLDALYVGATQFGAKRVWCIPERNHLSQEIGIAYRFADGTRRYAKGSRPALTYEDNWRDCPRPLFVVEGASDTAAGLALGLSVIGRPSCLGGVKHLTRMLTGFWGEIVIVAERDRKRHEDLAPMVRKKHRPGCGGCRHCWPGLSGAQQSAARLRKALRRDVRHALLPDDAKDLRAWLNAKDIDLDDQEALAEAGQWLVLQITQGGA
jgi:hypothetical protein